MKEKQKTFIAWKTVMLCLNSKMTAQEKTEYSIPVKTMESEEGPALGVAVLAGVASGIFDSVAEGCERMVKCKDCVCESETAHEEYMKCYDIYQKIYPETKEIFTELANV